MEEGSKEGRKEGWKEGAMACKYPCQNVQWMELITATTSLTVTASHRIIVLGAHAEEE